MNEKNLIANYELNDYKYSGFWEGRRYEHESEVMLLKKLFSRYVTNFGEKRMMDIGGAYGRLADLYAGEAKETILADYSMHELTDGINNLKGKPYFSKVSYLALNAYKIPLQEHSIDVVLSVRVMHHLKDTETFFGELYRILTPGGTAIIEFANGDHILARIKRFLKGQKHESITQVSHKADSQGIKAEQKDQVSIMYNFSPEFVKYVAEKTGFQTKGTYACSFLRIPLLKKLISLRVLMFKEALLQSLLRKTVLTPSIFIVLQKPTDEKINRTDGEILCCPTCTALLDGENGVLTCHNGHQFPQQSDMIIDLRDPRPEEVTY